MNNSFSIKKILLPLLTILFILTLLINAAFAGSAYKEKLISDTKRPKWIDKPGPGVFIGISYKFPDEADARADALNDARRQIIESLGGIIESEFIDKIVESTSEVTTSDAFTSSRIKVVSRNIIAVKPEKTYIEKWKRRKGWHSSILYQAYVAVPFSEQTHKKFMGELIGETYKLGRNRYRESLNIAAMGQVFLAIDQLKEINDYVLPLTEITGLSPSDLVDIKKLKEDAEACVKGLQTGIRIEGEGDRQPAKFGAPLSEPLTVSVFCQQGDKHIPLEGLKTDFQFIKGKGTLTPTAHTDVNGKAICEVREIGSAGKIEVKATVHFPEGYNIQQNRYTFHILPENKVIVKIIETNLNKTVDISYLENILLQRLSSEGFTAVENEILNKLRSGQVETSNPDQIADLVADSGADLVLIGTVSSGQINKIREGFYFARARGVLRVFNIKQQSVVGNFILEDKDAGNSEENAGAKAISKVSDELVQKFLSELGL